MKEDILRRFETATETPISERLPIPKIRHDKKAKEVIATGNLATPDQNPITNRDDGNTYQPSLEWADITLEETNKAIKLTSNWKTPGIDRIANYWIKHMTSLHDALAKAFNEIIENPENCPAWLTNGTTFLLPKPEETKILKCLSIYKISPILIQFLTQNMRQWSTTLILNHIEGQLKSRPLNINSGIFQGDSYSPLLFSVALAPLSSLLNETGYGYNKRSGEKINHLFYKDDLKTYAKNDKEQTGILHTVKTFSDDNRMEFGLEK
ncbi:uncharacterized protein LOC119572129 [Penaeus monodon]|uniref:uncharacterized protein LOC119572129 n=1 Tax=Penaeus monodon TaxID=6687 RepID=UPI0018A71168|nr:uncharacterized protein LOC119572129 [Penaeus monodon]